MGVSRQRGVTLIEICIVVAIMAMAAGVVIVGTNGVRRVDLRKGCRGLGSVVRRTYDLAALGGQTYRLVLRPGKGEIGIESTEAALRFDGQSGAFIAAAEAAAEAPPQDDRDAAEAPTDTGPAALKALFGINKLGAKNMAAGFQKAGTFRLPGSVTVLSVWTDGLGAAATDGEAYLHFFANGYTQDALIALSDGPDRTYTLRVQALTGRVIIYDHLVEAGR